MSPLYIQNILLHRRYRTEGQNLIGRLTEISQPSVSGKEASLYASTTITYEFNTPEGKVKSATIAYRQNMPMRTHLLPFKYNTPIKVLYLDDNHFFPL